MKANAPAERMGAGASREVSAPVAPTCRSRNADWCDCNSISPAALLSKESQTSLGVAATAQEGTARKVRTRKCVSVPGRDTIADHEVTGINFFFTSLRVGREITKQSSINRNAITNITA